MWKHENIHRRRGSVRQPSRRGGRGAVDRTVGYHGQYSSIRSKHIFSRLLFLPKFTCTQAVIAALRVITSGVAPLADICCKILMALRHSPPRPQAVMTELYAAARGWRPALCIWSSVTMHSFHLPILAHPARVAWNTPSVLATPWRMGRGTGRGGGGGRGRTRQQ